LKSLATRASSLDPGAGEMRITFDAQPDDAIRVIRDLRKRVESSGGRLVIERGSIDVRRDAGAWGEIGPTVELMRSIKNRFDPAALLNPGRFAGGI
jgi:glycolate oxidase FAD binding subunit